MTTSTLEYGPITACQSCGHETLTSAMFLGYLPPVNRMRPVGAPLDREPWFPAELLYCPQCHLVQLGFAVEPDLLFPPDYPYTSGTTRILRENFADLHREVAKLVGLSKNDLVVDIGSNDGTLLSNFAGAGHRVCGVEPSLTAKIAEKRGIPTLMTFFGSAAVDEVLARHGQPRVVTATNVFAHIHGIHGIIENILRLVGDDGVFVSESHYLGGLLATAQYDTVYHEHLRYYSLTSLKALLERHGLRVFHVTRIPTHGGSIRVYASRSPRFTPDDTVRALLEEEAVAGLASADWIPAFREAVQRSKIALYDLIADLKRQGARIYGVGAPSRASTLVNYVGLDEGILECVLEVDTSMKLNKYMPGTRIPVVTESRLESDPPTALLLLSWHIAPELMRNLKRKGYKGDFIVPLPQPRLVRNADVAAD